MSAENITRESILDAAKKCVCSDRETQYGAPEDNFKIIAGLWSVYLGVSISSHDVGIMQALLKIARIASGQTKADNYIDLAGYAACSGEVAFHLGEGTDIPIGDGGFYGKGTPDDDIGAGGTTD